MDGKEFARWVETELSKRGIKKGDFHKEVGVSSTALYNWRRGKTPTQESIDAIENYFGVRFGEKTPQSMDAETAELLESVRTRQDLKMLFHSARDLPPSSVYEVLAEIERRKENSNY